MGICPVCGFGTDHHIGSICKELEEKRSEVHRLSAKTDELESSLIKATEEIHQYAGEKFELEKDRERLSARVRELEQKENPWGPCYSSVGGEYVYRTLLLPSGYPVVMIWDDEDWVVSIIDSNDLKNFISDKVVILCPDPSLPNDAPDNAAS